MGFFSSEELRVGDANDTSSQGFKYDGFLSWMVVGFLILLSINAGFLSIDLVGKGAIRKTRY